MTKLTRTKPHLGPASSPYTVLHIQPHPPPGYIVGEGHILGLDAHTVLTAHIGSSLGWCRLGMMG